MPIKSINVFSFALALTVITATTLPHSTYAYSISWAESIHSAYYDKYFHRLPDDGRVFLEGYAGLGNSLFTFMLLPEAGEASTVATVLELTTLISSYQNIPGETISSVSGYFALLGPDGVSRSLNYGLTTDHSLTISLQEQIMVTLQTGTEYLAYMDLAIDTYETASFLANVTYGWDQHHVTAEGHLRIASTSGTPEPPAVPEPGTALLLLAGMAAVALFRKNLA